MLYKGKLWQLIVFITGKKPFFLLIIQIGEYSPHEIVNANAADFSHQSLLGSRYQKSNRMDIRQQRSVSGMGWGCCM